MVASTNPYDALLPQTRLHELAKRIVYRREHFRDLVERGLDPAADLLDERFELLRKCYPHLAIPAGIGALPYGLWLDEDCDTAWAFGERVRLSPRQWRMLRALGRACPHLLSWDQLERQVYGDCKWARYPIRQILLRLRRKLRRAGLGDIIETRAQVGCRMLLAPAWAETAR